LRKAIVQELSKTQNKNTKGSSLNQGLRASLAHLHLAHLVRTILSKEQTVVLVYVLQEVVLQALLVQHVVDNFLPLEVRPPGFGRRFFVVPVEGLQVRVLVRVALEEAHVEEKSLGGGDRRFKLVVGKELEHLVVCDCATGGVNRDGDHFPNLVQEERLPSDGNSDPLHVVGGKDRLLQDVEAVPWSGAEPSEFE